MELKAFLQTMTTKERESFASRCETSAGHLRNLSYGYRRCAESLAIAIERESAGQVTAEELRSDVDWAFIRGAGVHGAKPRTGALLNAPNRGETP